MKLSDNRPNKRAWRNFNESRKYARSLNLTSREEWKLWIKSGNLPQDIPVNPAMVYASLGWLGWGDWLNTGNLAPKDRKYSSFDDARKFVRSLGLKGQTYWRKWSKSGNRPTHIPGDPHKIYHNSGWSGWGDWLGTRNLAPKDRNFRPFDDARCFVQSLNLKSLKEWATWAKSDDRPQDIPSAPNKTYKQNGWVDWGDFLRTGTLASQKILFKPFNEAQSYAHSLNLKSEKEWRLLSKKRKFPQDIPAKPDRTYAKFGWAGWGDWLGTGKIANQHRTFRLFSDAQIFAKSLHLAGKEDWAQWTATDLRPEDIPADPARVYAKEWISWADWLGCDIRWTIEEIRRFVTSLFPSIHTLSQVDLYIILQAKGLVNTQGASKDFIKYLLAGKLPKDELEKFCDRQPSVIDGLLSNEDSAAIPNNEFLIQNLSEDQACEKDLPIIETKDILAGVDSQIQSSYDEETVEYLIESRIAAIWRHVFLNESGAIEQLKQYSGDNIFAKEVSKRFVTQYQLTKDLEIPKGYSAKFLPNLMQRYIAYLLKTRKRIGNWSGTGSGKTISAILTSRVIQAKITIICCPNNVIDTWINEIKATYPDSIVYVKSLKIKNPGENRNVYILLNYEFFQQTAAEVQLKKFLNDNNLDFVVIDEIHYSKQRVELQISRRLKTLTSFLSQASLKNENLHVLGMSATPVINTLLEGKALLELITGVHHDDLRTQLTRDNCVALYKKLVLHGVRYVPQVFISTQPIC